MAALLAAVLAGAAPAPGRPGLPDLAYVLGESHALRQACRSREDMYWRDRMERLLDAEGASDAEAARLTRAFNAGFAAARTAFPGCDVRARAAAAETAGRGRALAQALASP